MIRLHKFEWGTMMALRGGLGGFGSVGSPGKRYVVGGKDQSGSPIGGGCQCSRCVVKRNGE